MKDWGSNLRRDRARPALHRSGPRNTTRSPAPNENWREADPWRWRVGTIRWLHPDGPWFAPDRPGSRPHPHCPAPAPRLYLTTRPRRTNPNRDWSESDPASNSPQANWDRVRWLFGRFRAPGDIRLPVRSGPRWPWIAARPNVGPRPARIWRRV